MYHAIMTFRQTGVQSLRTLAERPWTLFLFLLLLNALAYPYGGITHDARLYGMQVLNRMTDGAYNEDLFLRYGSQDDFSIFSPVVAPIASVLGLEWAFFLGYVLANTLFIFSLQRFVRALLPDPLLSTLALVYLVLTPISYGGFGSFHVVETFLTPRVIANSLVLLALDQLLRGRYVLVPFLLLASALMHPLMAFGAVLLLPLVLWFRFLSPRWCWAGVFLATMAAIAVLAYPPLGYRVFGRMDDEWLDVVAKVSPYLFPLQWSLDDWLAVFLSQVIVTLAAVLAWRDNRRHGQLLAAVAILAAGAMVANVAGGLLGYKLLIQGQPYRFLWLVRLLQVPLTLQLSAHLFQQGGEPRRFLALGLLSTLAHSLYASPELQFLVLSFALLSLALRSQADAPPPFGDSPLPCPPAKPALSSILAISMVIGLLGGVVVREFVIAYYVPTIRDKIDGRDVWRVAVITLGPVVWLGIGLWLFSRVQRSRGLGRNTSIILSVGILFAQLLPFACTLTDYYQTHWRRHARDTQFVARYLKEHRPTETHPCRVYWSSGQFDVIWLDLRATSYFAQHEQVQGAVFQRQTAMEGKRRAAIVGPFEMAFLKDNHEFVHPIWLENMRAFFRLQTATVTPSRADLEALLRDDKVDYAILPYDFDGLATASNGHLYIYDCRQLHSSRTSSSKPAEEGVSAPRFAQP